MCVKIWARAGVACEKNRLTQCEPHHQEKWGVLADLVEFLCWHVLSGFLISVYD